MLLIRNDLRVWHPHNGSITTQISLNLLAHQSSGMVYKRMMANPPPTHTHARSVFFDALHTYSTLSTPNFCFLSTWDYCLDKGALCELWQVAPLHSVYGTGPPHQRLCEGTCLARAKLLAIQFLLYILFGPRCP